MPLFFYLKLLCLEITEKNIQIYFCKHGVYIKCICSQIKCNKKASKYIIANTVSNVNVHIWFPKINNKHIIQQPNTRVYPKEIFIKAQFFSRKKQRCHRLPWSDISLKSTGVNWTRIFVQDDGRKKSLKEQPSYLKEVGAALTRREELLKLKVLLESYLFLTHNW